MSVILSLRSPIAADRFRLTLILSLAAHVLVVLGIGFAHLHEPANDQITPPFEVTLVENETHKTPEETDYLAQANQEGGGNTTERVRPSAPLPIPSLAHTAGNADIEQTPKSAQPPADQTRALAVDQISTHQVPLPKEAPDAPQPAPINAAALIQRSEQIARLSAEISATAKTYARRPRQTYISASTKEYRYAAYMEAWTNRVVAVGTMYYVQDSSLSGLTGQLRLDVAIDPDGDVASIDVIRSSGVKALDDAARRIVKLGAPYAPLPENIRADTDVLHIIRTWQFLAGGQVETSN